MATHLILYKNVRTRCMRRFGHHSPYRWALNWDYLIIPDLKGGLSEMSSSLFTIGAEMGGAEVGIRPTTICRLRVR